MGGLELTDRQLALLIDLVALERAGMIFGGDVLQLVIGSRTREVNLDAVVTPAGHGAVKALASRRKVLAP